jgi:hypothetical protein
MSVLIMPNVRLLLDMDGYQCCPRGGSTARIVSAVKLKSRIALRNLREALEMSNPDNPIWLEAYREEYEGLKRLNTYTEIDERQPKQLEAAGCEVVPSVNLFNIKPNEKGKPYRAKSRT